MSLTWTVGGRGPATLEVAASARPAMPSYPDNFHAYLAISDTGRVTIFSGKVEMGQGVQTSLAQMAAEELGVDLASIDMVLGDTQSCPWDMGTFGSMTSRFFGPALRTAAANARSLLTALAATRLGVAAGELILEHGIARVVSEPTRRVSIAELSKDLQTTRSSDHVVSLRSSLNFREMGLSAERLDAAEKVTGSARYAGDIRLEGMLYARILRPPMHGALLTTCDTTKAAQLPGVIVIQRDNLIAVLHAEPDTAASALAQVHADWQLPKAVLTPDNIFQHIVAHAGPEEQVALKGDVITAPVAQAFETTFQKGYVAHAPMEPHVAVADVRNDGATVWASTQTPFPTRDRVAKVLGLHPKAVRIITPLLGGGFGGKSRGEQTIEAARLSQICGKPVQVEWTRAEEFFYDTFDPACVVRISSGLDQQGKISRWDYTVLAAGERGAVTFYDIPNILVRSAGEISYGGAPSVKDLHPFGVGPWRGPGANMNVFATESQIDIMAAAACVDPLAFRLDHIQDARMRRVLEAAARTFGWSPAAGPSGRGQGIACSSDAGSVVATMAEVQVDKVSGKVTVIRIVCAQDMGVIINPNGAKMQIEGGLSMGLGYSLTEELRFHGGEIFDRNFENYHLPRFSDVPPIEVVLVENDALAPQGCGEPATTTTGAVIANAIFDATGARMFRLPMTPTRVAAALAELGGLGVLGRHPNKKPNW